MSAKTGSTLVMTSFFTLVGLLILYSVFFVFSPQEAAKPTPDLAGETVRVLRTATGEVEEYPLEEVVFRTLAGEMGASRPEEALKAQAVAARTYIARRMSSGTHSKEGAEVCDNYGHCQEFLDDERLNKKWGEEQEKWAEKLKQAVAATEGEVITMGEELIDPLYHAVCGGRTERAGAYWYNDLPALTSVTCDWDSHHAKFTSELTFSASELTKLLGVKKSDLDNLKISKLSETGRAMTVSCGGKEWAGRDFRTLLGLNSTNFNWLVEDESYTFFVLGYGHGVGMCQAGAIGLAEQGYDYKKIIEYYYSGASVTAN